MKTIGFRVDVASHIGTGHLQRCLTLAHQLKSLSVSSVFFIRGYEDGYFNSITESGFKYYVIGNSIVEDISNSPLGWLGVTQQQDAYEFLEAAKNISLSGLVIDHYSINYIWEDIVRKKKPMPTIVIDDLANRYHNCDILIDQNYWPNSSDRYKELTPDDCLCLLGPEFAILKKEFLDCRDNRLSESTINARFLVNFGGVGNKNLWEKIIPALIMCTKYKFHIVTGKLPNKDFVYLEKLVFQYSHIYIEENTSEMFKLMQNSAFCIGACGSTVWERFCLGLNSALIDIAENQRELVKYLDEQELIDYLGSLETITTEEVINFITNLQLDSECYINRKSKIQALVDGLGPKRIESHIIKIIN